MEILHFLVLLWILVKSEFHKLLQSSRYLWLVKIIYTLFLIWSKSVIDLGSIWFKFRNLLFKFLLKSFLIVLLLNKLFLVKFSLYCRFLQLLFTSRPLFEVNSQLRLHSILIASIIYFFTTIETFFFLIIAHYIIT